MRGQRWWLRGTKRLIPDAELFPNCLVSAESMRSRGRKSAPPLVSRQSSVPPEWLAFARDAHVALLVIKAGRIVAASAAAARLLGFRGPAALAMRPVAALVAPKDRRDFLAAWRRLPKNGTPRILELACLRQKGTPLFVEWTASAIPAGRSAFRIAMLRDVSARHRELTELLASNRLLQQVFDAVPERLFVKDREGKYLRVNRAQAEAMGISAAEFTG